MEVEKDLEQGPDNPNYGTEQPAPPDYNQIQKDAPPSYQSIYGEIKEAKAGSSGLVDFLVKLLLILLNTLCCTIMMALILAVPITMIVIGAVYKDDCPAQDKIPIYLIVGGAFTIAKNLMDLCSRWSKRRTEDGEDNQMSKQGACSSLFGCFLFAWFIAGNVWIYGTDPNTDNVNALNYCNGTLYYFSFWLLNSTYIILGLLCCCFCCAACAAGVSGGTSENS
ncbi:transmembrane protein 272-like isoform X2 [Antedon mediterranea]|uniref:transmembrane protein 272-like isoform X2 n=1 Tax=Antedon mediterranea TaxID=105859 RepID=UPI003AF90CF5